MSTSRDVHQVSGTMLRDLSLISREDLLSSFLAVDHGLLSATEVPKSATLEATSRERVLALIEVKENELQTWRASVAGRYADAFDRSARVVDAQLEKENFAELKRLVVSSLGLHAFLELLLHDKEPPSVPEVDTKLQETKAERERLEKDNASLVASVAALFDEVQVRLRDAKAALKTALEAPPLEPVLSEALARKKQLQKAVEEAERANVHLESEIRELDGEGRSFDETMAQEVAETTLIRELLQRQKEDRLSERERREDVRERMEKMAQAAEAVAALLKRVGGTEVESVTEQQILLKLKTDVACRNDVTSERSRTFWHRLRLDLDPKSGLVCACQLQPDAGIALEMLTLGLSPSSAVAQCRSCLFIILTRRLHLECVPQCTFAAIDAFQNLWRVALPDGVEIEMKLPSDWPFSQTEPLQLLDMQSPSSAMRFDAVVEAIRESQFTDVAAFLRAIQKELRG